MEQRINELAKKRRAIKKYITKKIPQDILNYIFEATVNAPSSLGLEAWRMINISSDKMKKEIKNYFKEYNKKLIEDSSNTILFITKNKNWIDLNNLDYKNKIVNKANIIGKKYGFGEKEVEDLIQKMHNNNLNEDYANNDNNKTEWLKRQVYISASFMMLAAIENDVESTPMEGYENKPMIEFLKKQNLIGDDEEVAFAVSLGYRVNSDDALFTTYRIRENWKNKTNTI